MAQKSFQTQTNANIHLKISLYEVAFNNGNGNSIIERLNAINSKCNNILEPTKDNIHCKNAQVNIGNSLQTAPESFKSMNFPSLDTSQPLFIKTKGRNIVTFKHIIHQPSKTLDNYFHPFINTDNSFKAVEKNNNEVLQNITQLKHANTLNRNNITIPIVIKNALVNNIDHYKYSLDHNSKKEYCTFESSLRINSQLAKNNFQINQNMNPYNQSSGVLTNNSIGIKEELLNRQLINESFTFNDSKISLDINELNKLPVEDNGVGQYFRNELKHFDNKIKKRITDIRLNDENSNGVNSKLTYAESPKNNNKQRFKNLLEFLERLYMDGYYNFSLILAFDRSELVILAKMLDVPTNNSIQLDNLRNEIRKKANNYFQSQENRKKGYKVTNNKRFIFRKIKAILFEKYKKKHSKGNIGKKYQNFQFFNYYFRNTDEFKAVAHNDGDEIKKLLYTYKEHKMDLLWQFKKFTKEFSLIFFNFQEELRNSYYNKRLQSVKFYLDYLNNKDLKYIQEFNLPCKNLPPTNSVVKQYMVDFYNSFGEYLVHGD